MHDPICIDDQRAAAIGVYPQVDAGFFMLIFAKLVMKARFGICNFRFTIEDFSKDAHYSPINVVTVQPRSTLGLPDHH